MRYFISGILFLLISPSVLYGQGLVIKTGATVINNGNLIIKNNLLNDGIFSDNTGTVIFSGTTQTIGGTAASTFNNLTVSSGSTTTISTSGQTLKSILLCNGTLNADGKLTLLSIATRTALIDGSGTGQVLGNIIMQRYLPSGFGYKYFSSPFQAAPVSEFGDDMTLGAYTFYKYDENRTSTGWVSYHTPTSNPLVPLQGYAVNFGSGSAANTVDIAGVVNNGSLSVNLSNHNYTYTKGFGLIGNPYPSPIDWDAPSGWTKTNIDNAIYLFKASTTDQYGGTYSSYVNGIPAGLDMNIIPSMQGFFIHVSDVPLPYPVNGTLGLDNRVRITDLTHSFSKSKGSFSVPLLRLTAGFSDDLASADPMVIYFDEKGTPDFDGQLDALKLLNTDLKVPNLYNVTPNGTKLSISALSPIADDFCKVPLGLKLNRAGNIIFKIRDIDETLTGMRIYLTDIVAGTEQDLLPDKEYTVSLAIGEYNNRFFLNLSDLATGVQDLIPKSDLFSIYLSDGLLKAEINILTGKEGTLMIHNLTGQMLFLEKIYKTGYHEFNPRVQDGIYIVTYICGAQRSSIKIFIHK